MSTASASRLGIILVFLACLELSVRSGLIAAHVVAPPTIWVSQLASLLSQERTLFYIIRTMSIIFAAITSSIVIGFLSGAVIHSMPRFRAAIDPFLSIYYALPFFIFYPVLVAIFGISPVPIILMGFASGVVAMMIATIQALDSIPRIYGKLGRMLRLSPARAALMVKLPGTMPRLFTGIKLAIAYSFTGVIGSEFILSSAGLGYAISHAYSTFDTPTLYAFILLVATVSVVIVISIHGIETRLAALHSTGSRGAAVGDGSSPGGRWRRTGDILLVSLALIMIWQALSWALGGLALPSPMQSVATLHGLIASGQFARHAQATFSAFALAFLISIVLGLIVGSWFGFSKLAGEIGEPFLVSLYSLPKVTLFPVILLVMGIGISSKVGFGVLHGFIPLALFTINGIRNVRAVHMKVARAMRMSRLQEFRSIIVPSVLPALVAGLKVSFSITLLGVIIAEMFASYRGLGQLIMTSITIGNTSIVMAVAIFLYAFAGLANVSFSYLQRSVAGERNTGLS